MHDVCLRVLYEDEEDIFASLALMAMSTLRARLDIDFLSVVHDVDDAAQRHVAATDNHITCAFHYVRSMARRVRLNTTEGSSQEDLCCIIAHVYFFCRAD